MRRASEDPAKRDGEETKTWGKRRGDKKTGMMMANHSLSRLTGAQRVQRLGGQLSTRENNKRGSLVPAGNLGAGSKSTALRHWFTDGTRDRRRSRAGLVVTAGRRGVTPAFDGESLAKRRCFDHLRNECAACVALVNSSRQGPLQGCPTSRSWTRQRGLEPCTDQGHGLRPSPCRAGQRAARPIAAGRIVGCDNSAVRVAAGSACRHTELVSMRPVLARAGPPSSRTHSL